MSDAPDTINDVDMTLDGLSLPAPMVARVVVDVPLPHLDRPFDYAVPPELQTEIKVGCRVKVRFSGQQVNGFVVSIGQDSAHPGKLSPVLSVVSSEPVLHQDVWQIAESIADRYAGTRADILRLAIPPRNARAEARPATDEAPAAVELEPVVWPRYAGGPEFLDALADGGAPRVVFDAVPGSEPERLVAEAIAAASASGRGSIVCVPDAETAHYLAGRLDGYWGEDRVVVLTSALKPAARYRAFIEVLRGEKNIVVGTRGAAWAPVKDLGLVVVLDDGSDLHVEQHAPYPHAREVLLTRSLQTQTGVLLVAHARTVEATSLVQQGWCKVVAPDPITRRRAWPQVEVTDGTERGDVPVRLPDAVFRTIRDTPGPVLIQVPRQGYRTVLACQTCRARARCRHCEGVLAQDGASSAVRCRWCNQIEQPWICRECGGTSLRAPVVGELRTAEEFARAFPERKILTSGGQNVLEEIEPGHVIVLATPGAEPRVTNGYEAVILLDTGLMLARDDVRVVAESHRRWFEALALAGHNAKAVAVGDLQQLQGLVRGDPVQVAERELMDRAQTHLPPIGRLAVVDGPPEAIDDLAGKTWTANTEVLGPVPTADGRARLLLRSPRSEGLDLARMLHAAAAERSALKAPPLRIQIDPLSF